MSLNLSKLPSGVLNDKLRERIYESFDPSRDTIASVLRKVLATQFSENYSIINSEFRGVCLYVLSDEEIQGLVTTGALGKILNTSQKSLVSFKACRVYIPEIHTSRALPDDILNPTKKEKLKMEALFPIYLSENEEVASKTIKPGSIVTIKIKNHNGGGTYSAPLNSSNSVLSIYNEKKIASSNAFKCEILRFSRITNSQGGGPSSGIVITDEKEPRNSLDAGTLKQQYIKYLYEKELYFIDNLRKAWSPPTPPPAAGSNTAGLTGYTAFKKTIDEVFSQVSETSVNAKKLFWLLMYKLSSIAPTGLTNASATVINAGAIDDSYGIFKTTKEKFDTLKLKIKGKKESERNEIEKEILAKVHSDVLDPKFSIQFFLEDFKNYLTNNGTTLQVTADAVFNSDSDRHKKITTKYFTENDNRVGFIFTSDFKNIGNIYSTTGAAAPSNPPDVTEFATFQAWLTSAVGGAAVDISSFEKIPPERKKNSQTLDQEQPKDTKDECHSNYPQRNSYLEHVDAQKALMRRYIDSPLSGQDLMFLEQTHQGVKNIKIGDILIDAPFKVIRYDGLSGFEKDPKRWFNHLNLNNFLLYNERYKLGYYKSNDFITKISITSLGLKEESNETYKSGLNFMYDLGRPMPHFLITPKGQVIQLVDAAITVNNGLPSRSFSINIAFADGIGEIKPFSGENNTVIDNYILVKTDPSVNLYRPHKIGSKAALEAAHRLIQFLSTKTKIKYFLAAQDFKLNRAEMGRSNIQAYGHYRGISGMNFIYYAWTYGLAYRNNGKNILSKGYGYN